MREVDNFELQNWHFLQLGVKDLNKFHFESVQNSYDAFVKIELNFQRFHADFEVNKKKPSKMMRRNSTYF